MHLQLTSSCSNSTVDGAEDVECFCTVLQEFLMNRRGARQAVLLDSEDEVEEAEEAEEADAAETFPPPATSGEPASTACLRCICLWPREGWDACALSEVSDLSVSN